MHASQLYPTALLTCALALACGPKDTSPAPTTTPESTTTATASTDPVPDDFGPLTPHIVVTDVAAAVDFYGKAFGAQTVYTLPGPDGTTLMHAQVLIGDSVMMIDPAMGPMKDPTTLGGSPVTLMLYVEDPDAVFDAAVAAGGTPIMPLADQFWGDRYGMVLDPAGHMWAVASHIENLTDEQMMKRAELAFVPTEPHDKKHAKAPPPPAWAAVEGTPATKRVPDGYHTLTMSLTVSGAAEAIEFYKKAFGATERGRMPRADGRLMHAEIEIDGDILMLADEFPEMGGKSASTLGGSPVLLHHYTADVDGSFTTAIDSGAKELSAPEDMPWGDRYGSVVDPVGFPWGIASHVEDVTPEQIEQRMAEAYAEQPAQ